MLKIAAATALLQLCAAGVAAAQSYSDFQRFCVDTDADPAAIHAAARDAGWQAVPADLVAGMGEDGDTASAGYFAPGDVAGFLFLIEGSAPLGIDERVRARSCLMISDSVGRDSARERLRSYLAVGDMIDHEVDDGLWLFSKTPTGFRDERSLLGPGPDVAEAARRRELRYAGAGADARGPVMLVYGRLVAEDAE